MDPAAFVRSVLPEARAAAQAVGFWPSVVLAQWADETGWGSSFYWTGWHNPAGISPGGQVADYPSVAAGVAAYIQTANQHYYDPVRRAYGQGAVAQAVALGRSPWAASRYNESGGGPGSDLLLFMAQAGLRAYDTAQPPPPPPAPPPPAPPVVPPSTGPTLPGEEDMPIVKVIYGTTGSDGTAYVDLELPPGTNTVYLASANVLDAVAFNPPHHDVDLPGGALDHSGVVCQPCVGAESPGHQRIRLAGGAPLKYYDGWALVGNVPGA